MTKDKWLDTKEAIKTKFDVSEETQEELGPDIPGGNKETVIFDGPAGKMKLEFIEKPRLLDEKTIYSNRIGSDVKVEKVYDEDDLVSFMKAYRWNPIEEDWQEIEMGGEMNF